MKRSLLYPIALVAVIGLALSGCTKSANSGSNASASPSAITVAYSNGGQTLDPAEASDNTSDTLDVAAYDQLVTLGVKGPSADARADTTKFDPMLATTWKQSQDGLTWTFTLRKGVKFQSGNPFTSADVIYSMNHVKNSKSGNTEYGLADISTLTAKGPDTVVITLKQPNRLFLQYMTQYTFSILDSKLASAHNNAWLQTNTAGSGPYKIDSWNPATEAVMSKNPHYWGTEPAIGKVTIKFIAEAANRVQLLQKGGVDLATEIPPQNIATLKKDSQLAVRSDASNRILYLGLNNKIKPFDNKLVRQAMAYAVPYKKLLSDVMYGQATKMTSPLPSHMPGFNGAGDHYSLNLAKAKSLLVQAGYPNGFSFDLTLGSGFDDWSSDAVLIQASLKQIGVTMNIQNMARQQFLTAIAGGNVPAFITKWTSFINDPGYHLGFLLMPNASANYIHYDNPTVAALYQKANAATDPATSAALWAQVQDKITADSPWLYLYQYNLIVVLNKKLSGYVVYPDEIIRFAKLSEK